MDPARIAEVIANSGAEIIALQELDVGRTRSGSIDQAQAIAAHLRMKAYFSPTMHIAEEKSGNAILTALPLHIVKAAELPSLAETRGAMWVSVDVGGLALQIVNTHLGLRPRERMRQVETLLGPAWLDSPEAQEAPMILMGDLNAVPGSAAYRAIARKMVDVQKGTPGRILRTFPARLPLLRLDHVFVRGGLVPVSAVIPSDMLTRRASDHLPLLATLDIPVEGETGPTLRESTTAKD